MDVAKVDERFRGVFQDPRFRSIKHKQRKVKIDRRFQSMFTDDKFKFKTEIDKRGRPVHESSSENLKKYYRLSHKEKKRLKLERQKERNRLNKLLSENAEKFPFEEAINSGKESDTTAQDEDHVDGDRSDGESSDSYSSSDYESDEDFGPDLARGEGSVESSSDDDEEDLHPDSKITHHWSELDGEAERTNSISKRLALCNMDWERIKAVDLYVLFHGFARDGGRILKVSIYPSEFGLSRMAKEHVEGPAELRENEFENLNGLEGEKFQVEKLRQHQINRLKYYYAVIDCDSAETADQIYKECDGMEFESCAAKLDLRFIPDEITFDEHPPKDTADHLPDKDSYKPINFFNSALKQSKVRLTWDETDHSRLKVTMRKLKEDDLAEMDMKDFLASSSGEESAEDEEPVDSDNDTIIQKGLSRTTDQDQIARYRSLLLGDDDSKDDDKDDVHMEISWEPDLDSKEEEEPQAVEQEEDDLIEESEESDAKDEEDVEKDEDVKPAKKKKLRKRKKSDDFDEDPKEKASLEMLMMDPEDDGKKHFDITEILKEQQMSKKKKRKLGKEKTEDDFKIDVDDSRFSAVYTESAYALDPNNPAFKKTKGMKELLDTRQERVHARREKESESAEVKDENSNQDIDINKLVASVKSKTKKRMSKLKSRQRDK